MCAYRRAVSENSQTDCFFVEVFTGVMSEE
jgi:hypothetical protein